LRVGVALSGMNFDVPYAITRRLPETALAEGRARVIEALKNEGFGVLTEIDMQATLDKKLSVKIEPYVILGACNPALAHKALSAEPAVGLLLPCNVVVAQDGADCVLSAIAPTAMFAAMQSKTAIDEVARDAYARLRRALEKA
jgi:uncharacterized protein (DUF302 family)